MTKKQLSLESIICKPQKEFLNGLVSAFSETKSKYLEEKDIELFYLETSTSLRNIEALLLIRKEPIEQLYELLNPLEKELESRIKRSTHPHTIMYEINGFLIHLRDGLKRMDIKLAEVVKNKEKEIIGILDTIDLTERLVSEPLDEGLIKDIDEFVKRYKNTKIASIAATRFKSILPSIKKLNSCEDCEAVNLIWPLVREYLFPHKHIDFSKFMLDLIVHYVNKKDYDINVLRKDCKKLTKLCDNAYRSRNKAVIPRTIDLLKSNVYIGIILSLRGKRYPQLPIIYRGMSIDSAILEANKKNLSTLLFFDDFIYNDKTNGHNNISSQGLIEYLEKSGLVITKKLKKEIEVFLENYLMFFLDLNKIMNGNEKNIYPTFTELLSIVKEGSKVNQGKPFFAYDIEKGEFEEISFPSSKELTSKVEELVNDILSRRIVKNPGKRYVEWKSLKKTPENLVYFLDEISKTCEKSVREEVLFYRDLLRKEETFAMTHYTKMHPEKIFFKNPEIIWRDFFAPWASGCCINPIKAIPHMADELSGVLNQVQIWWNGYQYGILYTLKPFNYTLIDSVEVNPAFFSKFKDKFKKRYNSLDVLLNGVSSYVEMQTVGEDFYFIYPTSNQKRIENWLKKYAKDNGQQLSKHLFMFMDAPLEKLRKIYLVLKGDKDATPNVSN